MFGLIREYQLDIMLVLCGACAILAYLMLHTRFLPRTRKRILIVMELMAFFLLWFDRQAYIFAGKPGDKAWLMVRVSNFMVFFLTPAMVLGLTLYLRDLLKVEGKMDKVLIRLQISEFAAFCGMMMAVFAAFTDLYYYFDENNLYHRGSGFLFSYVIPLFCPMMLFTVIVQYRKVFSRLIYASLVLYIFVPVLCGVVQIFTYGISIVNMSMVAVSISLYIFIYLDINNTVERAHKIEIQNMQGEQQRMRRLFDQTANAFVSAVEKKDSFTKGSAAKTAVYARRIAELAGKDELECEKVYYAALLHDIGIIGIPDSVVKKSTDPESRDSELMKKKPLIGKEILSSITEYPYLSLAAQYSHERYNGTGYPEGLKGEEIPEIARIVAVADAYVTMTTKKRFRESRPDFIAREAFIKGAGEEFDPVFSDIMIKIIDQESKEHSETRVIEKELVCGEYRDKISGGILIGSNVTRITFNCHRLDNDNSRFSEPSAILFDSYDERVHDNDKAIDAYHYLEYAEVWFDENSIPNAAGKLEETQLNNVGETSAENGGRYEISMGRYGDHLKLNMKCPQYEKTVVVVLPDGMRSAYIGLTGEHCRITDIKVEQTDTVIKANDIARLAEEVSFIDRMESDIRNVQINGLRTDSTRGVEIDGSVRLNFHTMSLPGSDLIWHCPYIVLFSSDNGYVGGRNYCEYALIKLCGEKEDGDASARNSLSMKKKPDFPGWQTWKDINGNGLECEVNIERKGSRIILKTENLGISIENTTVISDIPDKIYASITGDRVALTDIRVRR